jgi:hypothetical protein
MAQCKQTGVTDQSAVMRNSAEPKLATRQAAKKIFSQGGERCEIKYELTPFFPARKQIKFHKNILLAA